MFWHDPITVLKRQKLNYLGDHFGVGLGNGTVAHYTAENDFQVVSEEEFAQGRDVTIVRAIPADRRFAVEQRLRQIASNPRKYHATDWNCEVFANWLTGEKPESQQVSGWAIVAVLCGVAYLGGRT